MTKYEDTTRFLKDMTASAWLAQGFTVYLLVLGSFDGADAAQWRHADAILKILPPTITLWGIPLLAVGALFAWQRIRPLAPRVVLASFGHVFAGAAVAVVVLLVIRLIVGPQMPAFVPPEEGARPGFLLGMSAGFGEEVIFRLILTPVVYVGLRRWLAFRWSAFLTIVIVAASFALLHEVAGGAGAFTLQHFIARFMMPGVVMGLGMFVVSPAFVVAVHCSAHIVMPILFV